jgi:hypothetical protein
MKTHYFIGVLQLIIIIILAYQVSSLESALKTLTIQVESASNTPGQVKTSDSIPNLARMSASEMDNQNKQPLWSLDDIRQVIREEIADSIGHINQKTATVSSQIEQLDNLPSNPQTVDRIYSQVDAFISDGHFSSEEFMQVESALTTLNYNDRKSVLKKLAQAMNRTNVKANQ